MTFVFALLALAMLLFIALGVWTRGERQNLGLDPGIVIAADDAQVTMPTLRSDRLGLIGRPDHILRCGDYLIPVEQKPDARRAQPSHVLQLAARCLLVQEVFGVRPPYGLLVLAGGVQQRIPFTPALEGHLLDIMARMREWLATGSEPGPRWAARKCRACGLLRVLLGITALQRGLLLVSPLTPIGLDSAQGGTTTQCPRPSTRSSILLLPGRSFASLSRRAARLE